MCKFTPELAPVLSSFQSCSEEKRAGYFALLCALAVMWLSMYHTG